jgi:uncharacterized protein
VTPDLDAVADYVRQRLSSELRPTFTYHNAAHTTDDVVPAAARLAALNGIENPRLTLLLTGAWLHDVGFVERADGHELIGVAIAESILPQFGFDEAAVAAVRGLILATRVPQTPLSALEEALCDADLDVLGRDDFFARNEALRAERMADGEEVPAAQWWRQQAEFVASHRYFTAGAQQLRDAGKAGNLARLRQLAATSR